MLTMSDFSIPFIIETNASGTGLGAVLMQRHRPIAYLIKEIAPRHLDLSTYEKELMVVVYVVQKWRHYLLEHKFIIKTDHQSFKYLLDQRSLVRIIKSGLLNSWE